MTRCEDFYRKWKKEPNFCGLGKSSASTIEKYLGFVNEVSTSTGLPESVIYVNMPEGAVKPVLKFKKDSDLRQLAVKKIGQTLKDKHAVSLKYVNSILGISGEPKPFIPMTTEAQVRATTETFEKKAISDKIRYINAALDPPLLARIIDVMKKKDLDNEYQATIHLIIKGLEVVE